MCRAPPGRAQPAVDIAAVAANNRFGAAPLRPPSLSTQPHARACCWEDMMSNGSSPSLREIEARIAIARDNIRQLIEQATATSGAEDEARNADRLAKQNEELERLIKQRDALLKKVGR
jgi:hypothetical protein